MAIKKQWTPSKHTMALPGGVRICECWQKKLIEVKSMYAKRNLAPSTGCS